MSTAEAPPAPTPTERVDSTGCPIEGKWLNDAPDLGQSTITITRQPDGTFKATEDGMANFDGSATVAGKVLHIDFRTDNGYAGSYEWVLDDSCSVGDGKVSFTAGGQGDHTSRLQRVTM
jgi:hypothetical protein